MKPNNLSDALESLASQLLFDLKAMFPDRWAWLLSGREIIVVDERGQLLAKVVRGDGESTLSLLARLARQLIQSEPGPVIELPLSG